ncbi:hypothetical protein C8R46DRAFT_1206917 [Mycena filopes]|nr:hypothetical protein C8R46DRAFT_1206917 [Mycena filopes]
MSEETNILDALVPWKRKRFRPIELSWTKATDSLATDNPLVGVRSNKVGSRWTVFDKATDKLAIFFHAGVWAWGSPPSSGNLVPEGESCPSGVFDYRVTRFLGRRAEANYTINTQEDTSFHDAARVMEDHITAQEGFNKYNKPRRTWQDGTSDYSKRQFIFASRLVIRKNPYTSKDGPLKAPHYPVHPWVQNAVNAQKSMRWIPNPDMPGLHDYVDGKLTLIHPEDNHYFNSGDIVWFSFALTYEIEGDNWAPEYKPLDFIRVGRLEDPPDTNAEYTLAMELGSAYPALAAGTVALLDDDDDGNTAAGQKRGRDSDGDETMSDGGLSDMSAYSAAQAAKDNSSQKRQKVEPPPSTQKPPSKAESKAEEVKRRAQAKGKGKT